MGSGLVSWVTNHSVTQPVPPAPHCGECCLKPARLRENCDTNARHLHSPAFQTVLNMVLAHVAQPSPCGGRGGPEPTPQNSVSPALGVLREVTDFMLEIDPSWLPGFMDSEAQWILRCSIILCATKKGKHAAGTHPKTPPGFRDVTKQHKRGSGGRWENSAANHPEVSGAGSSTMPAAALASHRAWEQKPAWTWAGNRHPAPAARLWSQFSGLQALGVK